MHWTVPIFIITFNRLISLQQTIESFEKSIHTPYEIIIHDNHSTYPPLLEYLEELERQGVTVHRHDTNVTQASQLERVQSSIDAWYRDHDSPYYIVTDPDIALDEGDGNVLIYYAHLLDTRPDVQVVGPALHLDDLPDHYPLKHQVIDWETALWRGRAKVKECWEGREIEAIQAPIDTTFAMYRGGSRKFHRLNQGLRVYGPYQARHLDWYIDPLHMTDDQSYYLEKASGVSHWGGSWLRPVLAH